MSIQLNKPYKILPARHKRYETHYHLPAVDAVVIPLKALGDESSCDVRWEDQNGELHHLSNLMFANANLVPLNPAIDAKGYELWSHYYETQSVHNEK